MAGAVEAPKIPRAVYGDTTQMGTHPYDDQPLWPLDAVLVALRATTHPPPATEYVRSFRGASHVLTRDLVLRLLYSLKSGTLRSVWANLDLDEAAVDLEDWKRTRSESSTAADELDSTYMSNAVCMDPHHYMPHRMIAKAGGRSLCTGRNQLFEARSPVAMVTGCQVPRDGPREGRGVHPIQRWAHFPRSSGEASGGCGVEGRSRPFTWRWVREWCVAWWHSGREDDAADVDYEDTPSDMGYATPVSVETPLQSSVSRCTSLNVIRDPYASGLSQQQTPTRHLQHYDARSLPASGRLAARSVSSDSKRKGTRGRSGYQAVWEKKASGRGKYKYKGDKERSGRGEMERMESVEVKTVLSSDPTELLQVYTILIRLPPDSTSCDGGSGTMDQPSIKMIAEDGVGSTPVRSLAHAQRLVGRVDSANSMGGGGDYNLSLHPAGGFPVSPAINRRPLPDARHPHPAQRQDHPETVGHRLQGTPIGRGAQTPTPAQEEEEDSGEESRQEGREDPLRHLIDLHHHLDPLQHLGALETFDGVHGVHPSGAVGLLLLSVLYQQHDQPSVLRAVQRVFQKDLRADPHLPVKMVSGKC
uniref:Uncharacterized protein n=1 Tax=Timema tahoe TaxID=61484 RepID=A0A7R9FGH6_9NEOP|nr:unnamed protein product [Timema tahoe]